MTDRDTLLALAERVEGLSNPDREVDAEVAAALRTGTEHRWADNFPEWEGRSDGRVYLETGGPSFPAPAFTGSLDAAKTLVPKGWHVGMLTECDEDDSPSCCLTQNEEPCRDAVGRGADMALSLVAAALRARAGGL